MNKIIVKISGMHCRSCELLVEEKLSEISKIKKIEVNHKRGEAVIFYDSQRPSSVEIKRAVCEAGYSLGIDGKKPFLSRNPEDYKDLGIAAIFLVIAYFVLRSLGITDINIGSVSNPSSLSVVFLVGLTAGLSTCMALVGGLILGISARHAELHPEATAMQKFRPHLFFNLGRVGGYAILGGVLGGIGSVLQLSGGTLGLLTIVVGAAMLMLGMKLMGIFPRLENSGLSLPTSVSKFFGIKNRHEKEYSHSGSMITGALTFFLPCGFTQAMQLYAISTGSFSRGFLIMGLFALGTAPGLLGVGGLTSVIKGVFAKRFFKFSGILVVFLAFFNIANGYNLTGWQLGSAFSAGKTPAAVVSDPNVKLENLPTGQAGGVQIVNMTENSGGYAPNKFTIKKGVPVKWVIDAKAPYSCASSLVVPSLSIRKTLKTGENVIEFTPNEAGRIPFSCSMGMYTGSFNVVNDLPGSVQNDSKSATIAQDSAVSGGGSCGSGGSGASSGGCGGCGGGGKAVQPSAGKVETVPSTDAAKIGEQIIKMDYTLNDDIQPNTFTVKAGQPVKFVVDVKEDGQGCMSTVALPGLSEDVFQLVAGKTIEINFTPSKKGVYQITCAMGVPRGTITVE